MKPVTLYKPASVQEATQILTYHGPEAAVYAGGTDLLIRLKNRLNVAPKYLVDIKEIPDLKFIRETDDGGLAVGATTTITELVESELVGRKYPLLVETFKKISSPELRNQTTIAGDILQEVWCQYLRGNYPCWRNGGYLCYGAIGDNSYYHSVMGGRLCFAVYHGDASDRPRSARRRRQGRIALGHARDVARGADPGRRAGRRPGAVAHSAQ